MRFSNSPFVPALAGGGALAFFPVVERQPDQRQAKTMLSGPLPPDALLPASQRRGVISSGRPCGRALTRPTSAGISFFPWRKAGAARVLTGFHNRPLVSPRRKGFVDRFLVDAVGFLPVARAFFCALSGGNTPLTVNRRAHRLAFLLGVSPQFRQPSKRPDGD